MKRGALLRHLKALGGHLLREGARHSWWENSALRCRSAIPRHGEIDDDLARKICQDLGVAGPKRISRVK